MGWRSGNSSRSQRGQELQLARTSGSRLERCSKLNSHQMVVIAAGLVLVTERFREAIAKDAILSCRIPQFEKARKALPPPHG